MSRIQNPFHEAELQRRLDQLYLDGQTVIQWEELYLWYGTQKVAAKTYRDIHERWLAHCDASGLPEEARDVEVAFKRQQGVYAAIFRRPLVERESGNLADLAR